MSYQPITTVNISLATASVSRAGFGTPIFIGDGVWFKERTRTYTSIEGAQADLPTDSDEYIALQAAFSADVPPSQVKIGRRDADSITFTPEVVGGIGETFALTVVGTDDVAITASFTTTTGTETGADITAALAAGLAGIVGVTVTDNVGTLTLTKSATDAYSVNTIDKLEYTISATESAADVMVAITLEDDDFYFVATNDHTQSFVLALAADIEARTKLYFVTVQEADALASYSDTASDTLAKLRQSNYFRTSGWFHHEADTNFVELAYIGIGAPADPGKKIWANNRVTGYSTARNPNTGNLLTVTEKGNLEDRYANYTEEVGGISISRSGKVAGNEWIDVIRNRDFLEARITEAYQNFLINSPVVPYTDMGITRVRNVLSSTLNRYVETEVQPNILQLNNPFEINFPRRADISFGDIAAREFNGSFTGYLSGAIQVNKIQGTLTYEAQS